MQVNAFSNRRGTVQNAIPEYRIFRTAEGMGITVTRREYTATSRGSDIENVYIERMRFP